MIARRALVIAPHTDDAELGCGGTLARMAEEGTDVHIIAFSTAQESMPPEAAPDTGRREIETAVPKLGIPLKNLVVRQYAVRRLNEHRQSILEDLVGLGRRVEPDLVMLPSPNDMHQDHQVCHAEGLRAFKHVTVLGYELPWNNIVFSAEAFVTLEQRHMHTKLEALQCYGSQIELNRPYFQEEFLLGWARMRGLQIRAQYAEAFEVMRVRW